MDLGVLKHRLDDLAVRARREAARRTWLFRGSKYALGVTALGIAILLQFLNDTSSLKILFSTWTLPSTLDLPSACFILLLVLQFLAYLVLLLFDKLDTTDQYFHLLDAQARVLELGAELKHQRKFLLALQDSIVSASFHTQTFKAGYADDLFSDVMARVLNPITSTMEELFEFPRGAMFNFAIYIHDVQEGSLKCAFRHRNAELERRKSEPSRPWKVGVGHVGMCFAHDEGFLVRDIAEEANFQANAHADDQECYRAILSAPLRRPRVTGSEQTECDGASRVNVENEPYGVLILTSSAPGQFEDHHLALFRTLQCALEGYILTLHGGLRHE